MTQPDPREQAIQVMRDRLVSGGMDSAGALEQATAWVDAAVKMQDPAPRSFKGPGHWRSQAAAAQDGLTAAQEAEIEAAAQGG